MFSGNGSISKDNHSYHHWRSEGGISRSRSDSSEVEEEEEKLEDRQVPRKRQRHGSVGEDEQPTMPPDTGEQKRPHKLVTYDATEYQRIVKMEDNILRSKVGTNAQVQLTW
jgi:hypothetical protein